MISEIKKIYFVRHSESDIAEKKDDIRPLTEKGIEAAKGLVEYFVGLEIDVIYSSPYIRCIDTLRPLSKSRKLRIIENDKLRERESGGWVENFGSYVKKQWDDFEYKLINGESLGEVQKRNISALNDILLSRHKNIVIGCHGTVLSTIIDYYDSGSGYSFFNDIINMMPVIIEMAFEDLKIIGYVIKKSSGNMSRDFER